MTTRFRRAPFLLREELWKIANYLMSPGKGILALDQSCETLGMRLEECFILNTAENRRKFRDLVLYTSEELGDYISGVIITNELFLDVHPLNESVVEILRNKGIVTGIKLDIGLQPLLSSEGECNTVGLNELNDHCYIFKELGCHFAKWRCVYRVGDNVPSALAISNNAQVLARFASICQANRLVPIVEPEILPEGKHSLERAQQINEVVLTSLVKALNDHHVYLEGLILKVNFVTGGMQGGMTHTPEEVALSTITALTRTVPPSIMGIVFLAGGSCEDEATAFLDAINQPIARHPWPLSFSFGRGMLTSTMLTWAGEDVKIEEAQQVLIERAKSNSLAAYGLYGSEITRSIQKMQKEEEKDAALRRINKDKKLKTHRFYDKTIGSVHDS